MPYGERKEEMGKNRFAVFLTMVMAALVLVFGSTLPAKAAIVQNSKGDIVVDYPDNETNQPTAKAYKLIDVNFDYTAQQPKDPAYVWDSSVATWLSANGYNKYVGNNNAVVDFEDDKATDADKLYREVAAAIKDGSIAVTAEDALTQRAMGVYLVIVSGGVNTYKPMVSQLVPEKGDSGEYGISSGKVTMKAEKPTVDKTVDKAEVVGVQVGDDVPFEIVVSIPDYPENAVATKLVIADKMGKGLKFNDDISVYGETNGDKVADGKKLTLNNEYKIVQQDLGGHSDYDFVIELDWSKIKKYTHVLVTYTAELTSEADLTPTGNPNEVKYQYSNDPYDANSYEEIPDKPSVRTYGAKVKKVDGQSAALAGAEFILSRNQDGSDPLSFVNNGDGKYVVADGDDRNTGAQLAVGASGDQLGKLEVGGLGKGEYWLKETKAPDGYNLLSSPVKITIADDDNDGIVNSGSDGWVELDVVNKKGFQLPTTGGSGTAMFAAVGIVLVGGGAALYLNMKKRSGN